jgi:hypothetical protein
MTAPRNGPRAFATPVFVTEYPIAASGRNRTNQKY